MYTLNNLLVIVTEDEETEIHISIFDFNSGQLHVIEDFSISEFVFFEDEEYQLST